MRSSRYRVQIAWSVLLLGLLPALQDPPLPLNPDRIPSGTWVYEIRQGEVYLGDHTSVIGRREGLIVSTSFAVVGGAEEDRREGSVTVRADDLSPVASYVLLAGTGPEPFEARMRYRLEGDSLRVERTVSRQAFPPASRLPPRSRWSFPAAGRYDNQQIDLLVQALPLETGRTWTVHLIDPTVDHTIATTIRVVDARRTVTPAGTFEVWHIEVQGLATRIAYDVERAGRTLVAQYLPAQGVQLLLKRRSIPGGASGGDAPSLSEIPR